MISRFVASDKKQPKKYCVLLEIPEDGDVPNYSPIVLARQVQKLWVDMHILVLFYII